MHKERRGKIYKKGFSMMSGGVLAVSMLEGCSIDPRQKDYMEPLDKPGYSLLTRKEAGKELDLGIPKHYVDIDKKKGVPGHIIVPDRIVLHTTQSGPDDERLDKPAMDFYRFFQNQKPDGPYGAATQFAVGKSGDAVQMAELYENGVRRTYGTAGYYGAINIEVVDNSKFESKAEVPPAQFDKTVEIVIFSMKQYDIPLGSLDANWKAKSNAPIKDLPKGIYGHQQLNPENKWDPGVGFIKAVRDEVAQKLAKQKS